HQDEAVDAEVLVAAHGVAVDRSRRRRDRDLEAADSCRAHGLFRDQIELRDGSAGGVEVLEEAVPAVAPLDGAAARPGRHAAGEDGRAAGSMRLRSALDAAE